MHQRWDGEQLAAAPRWGLWSQAECQHLINYMVAMFVVKAIMKDKRNFHILLMMNNRTAAFYVICMEGTPPTDEPTSYLAQAVVSREEPFPISNVPTRGTQLCSRQGVKDNLVLSRMVSTSQNFPPTIGSFGNSRVSAQIEGIREYIYLVRFFSIPCSIACYSQYKLLA